MLESFYRAEEVATGEELAGYEGVMAKLVGDVVAHLTWRIDSGDARIEHIWVSKPLRRKRVGYGLLEEAAGIASNRGATRLVVSEECDLAAFFVRMGFASKDGVLVREVL